jgi:hypothetical protein
MEEVSWLGDSLAVQIAQIRPAGGACDVDFCPGGFRANYTYLIGSRSLPHATVRVDMDMPFGVKDAGMHPFGDEQYSDGRHRATLSRPMRSSHLSVGLGITTTCSRLTYTHSQARAGTTRPSSQRLIRTLCLIRLSFATLSSISTLLVETSRHPSPSIGRLPG